MMENNHMEKDQFEDERLDDIHMDRGRKGKEGWSDDWRDGNWNKPPEKQNPPTTGYIKKHIRFQINYNFMFKIILSDFIKTRIYSLYKKALWRMYI